MDAYYEYDGLQQVTVWKRGNLSPSGGPPYTGVTSQKQGEDFTYDQTGNWLGDVSDNPNFTQSRTHDVKNQITSITGPTGVIQPDYDNAGNMTLAPSPGSWTTGYTYKWDAWNRLVEIKQGTTVVGAYAYDALTRRTRKTVGGVTRDIYYDRQWRSVEERESNTVKVQHTWSPLDRWTLIRRKRNASGSTLNETLFCLRDYLDPVALANTSGVVVERYNYDAFGTVRIMNAAFGVLGNSAYEWEFLYHGEFRDKESELYNYGYRYLDTQLGRWLSRDPIEEEGGLNLYAFIVNGGTSDFDVMGTAPNGKFPRRKKNKDSDGDGPAETNQEADRDALTGDCAEAGGTMVKGECCCDGKKFDPLTHYCCSDGLKPRSPLPTVGKFCKIKMKGAQFKPLGLFSHCYLDLAGTGPIGWWPINMNAFTGKGEAVTGDVNTQWGGTPKCSEIKPNLKSSNRCKCTADCLAKEMKKAGNYTLKLGLTGQNCCERAKSAIKNCGCEIV
jgi:RHS repeat-associated protein